MKAAWYERQGAAGDVLVLGEMEDAQPRAGEVRIRVAFSGVKPGDIKIREDSFHVGMPYPRVIPHSDSSGIVDEVGEGVPRGMDRPTRVVLWRSIVPPFRNRRRVHRGSLAAGGSNPRSRAAGTRGLSRHPGITAHRAVHVTGPIEGRTVLVQGGAGAVGARWSGASHSSPEWLQDRESDCAWSPHRRGVGPPFLAVMDTNLTWWKGTSRNRCTNSWRPPAI